AHELAPGLAADGAVNRNRRHTPARRPQPRRPMPMHNSKSKSDCSLRLVSNSKLPLDNLRKLLFGMLISLGNCCQHAALVGNLDQQGIAHRDLANWLTLIIFTAIVGDFQR